MLQRKHHYLQIACNNTLSDALAIIRQLPPSPRIIIEAGTPLIKQYGINVIGQLRSAWSHVLGNTQAITPSQLTQEQIASIQSIPFIGKYVSESLRAQTAQTNQPTDTGTTTPYIVADLKTIDRGAAEAKIAADAGASAVVAMGSAPIETLNRFIKTCNEMRIDAMIDMMAVDQPIKVLRKLSTMPKVVILHRGVDETLDNKTKTLPIHHIAKIKGSYDVMVAIAGGDTPREIQSAVFNGADIVVVWKDFYSPSESTTALAASFLKNTR